MSERNRRVPVHDGHLARLPAVTEAGHIDEELIYRGEVIALLFNVSDVVRLLAEIARLLGGGEDAEEEQADGS